MTTSDWLGDSVIKIRGHPIALEFWPQLYRYGHNDQWKGTKSKWTDWRDVVERYRQGSPEQFWAAFSADSKHLKFTAIIRALHEERASIHAAVAECAHREYGAQFADLFTYRKGGEEHLMTKPSAIMKRYKELASSRDNGCYEGQY
ncbi:hypothetical protein DEU56DRAFT_740110 [Suillus clintonianus]|uniref:uncharacterized protein n=1 Tax=Suillus clintonianus TaxID=1904413 RepID=UPI001B86F21F|nr:uncharacterized protein DEU56DRAFT_740110 [Suillus clintonianus]KAG2131340.1 hypothetical protein DEU56DRAFT_740110 [Suillus clintonianus]